MKSLYDILLEAKRSVIDYNEGFSGYFGPFVANYLGIEPGWYINGKLI
jgi:hypothetical protein